jgi:hypothetical protein
MFPLIPSSLSLRPVDPTEIVTIVAADGLGLTRPDMSGYRKIPVLRTLKARPAIAERNERVVCKERSNSLKLEYEKVFSRVEPRDVSEDKALGIL